MASRIFMSQIWSSILSDSKVQEQLKTLADIKDAEEQAIQIVCKTLFLMIMDIKLERDEAIKKISQTNSEISFCKTCKKKVDKTDLDEGRIGKDEESVDLYDSDDQGNVSVGNVEGNMGQRNMGKTEDVVPHKITLRSQRKGDKGYRCLSKTSQKDINSNLKTDARRKEVGIILAPETLSLDEHKLHVNKEKRVAYATQTISVPETMAVDVYGNTDFFESEAVPGTKLDSPELSIEFASPVKEQLTFGDSEMERSPVLGKQSNTTPKSKGKAEKFCMPKSLDFESPPKEPLQPISTNSPREGKASKVQSSLTLNTEDLTLVPQCASTPRYSPLKFTHSLSSSVCETDHTSPSLLPTVNAKGSIVVDEPLKSFVVASTLVKLPAHHEKKTKSITRSASNFNNGASKENSRVLRRHHTDVKPGDGRLYEMTVEPPGPERRKKYKQARIFEMPLVPKTDVAKLTGGVPKMTFDAEVNAALEASIKSKELEDMMRNDKREFCSLSPLKIASQTSAGSSQKVQSVDKDFRKGKKHKKTEFKSPTKSLMEQYKSPKKRTFESPRKSPRKYSPIEILGEARKASAKTLKKERTGGLDVGGSDGKMLEMDEVLHQVNESPLQDIAKGQSARTSPKKNTVSLSPRKKGKRMSPKKKEKLSSPKKKEKLTSPKKKEKLTSPKKNEKLTSPKKSSVKISEEKPQQKEFSRKSSCKDHEETQSSQNASPKKESKKRKRRLPLQEDSYDVIPSEENSELGYAYQGEVVRKKAARRQLEGWVCHECKNWYNIDDLNPDEQKMLMNRCSRHRSKYNPVTNTPKDFWNPDWVDSDGSG